ncbi:CHAP domain-containing protein [Rhodococcus triatomae]|uniref:CHAP domain-containing protein n=1 Tax=Rhodococcus triatomae TaxID=300028 RepID=A0A1G8K4R0_9NOCA|nr:CHAP domain-containing protein [Rhodococcus triatomae]QNG18823.1 CHAP domain-containing protein [Rhodococcus triatomae]QNG25266.1 CHAP domain-containing protein [Rhodococcus triatomae]SDI38393.1 CHAP domain-containing protein [Rhodococcus triatomae]
MTTSTRGTRRRRYLWAGAAVVIALAIAVAGVLWWAPSRYLPWDSAPFPEIDRSSLDAGQARVVDILETEHRAGRPGTHYSEGIEEEWCADFVSWVMREAGMPLSNPHSGHWRIPGVYTLQEYYESVDRFEQAGGGYVPRIGDVVLYDNTSWVGQHTNVVVAVDGDTATTVGGNEFGRVRVHTLEWSGDSAVVGFGRLS